MTNVFINAKATAESIKPLHGTVNGPVANHDGSGGTVDAFKEIASDKEEYQSAISLVEALETYISAAEIYFGGGTPKITDNVVVKADAPSKSGSLYNVEHFATSLVLDGFVEIKHYFKNGLYTHNYKSDELPISVAYTDDGYACVTLSDIPINDLDRTYTVTVDGKYTVTYSPMYYVSQAVESDDVRLSELAKALYNYWCAAEAYVQ